MIKKLTINTIFILTIFFNKSVFGTDIISKIDFIPIENFSFIDEYVISKNFNLFKNKNTSEINSLEPKKINSFKYGRVLNKLKISYEIDYNKSKFKKQNIPNEINYQNLALRIKFLDIFNDRFKSNWKIFSGVNFKNRSDNELVCYEGKEFIVLPQNMNCNNTNKTVYFSSSDVALNIKSKSYGYEIGARNLNSSWGKKNLFEFGLKASLINYDLIFDTIFNDINHNYLDYLPQQSSWASYNFYSSLRQSRLLKKNWAIGYGVTFDKIIRQNYNKASHEKSYNENIRFDFQLSNMISEKLYFGLGGFISDNYLIGIDPLSYARGFSNNYGTNYIKYYLKLGYIGNQKNVFVSNEKIPQFINNEIILQKNSPNKKIVKNLKTNKSHKKSNLDKNKFNIFNNEDLKEYALDFAKKHDENKINFF
tara:strand:+ start:36 stop:1301 length:1266 start_codon:yes stop_codon:yes gene_type:complete